MVSQMMLSHPPECCVVCKYAHLYRSNRDDETRITGMFCKVGLFIPIAKKSCKRQVVVEGE